MSEAQFTTKLLKRVRELRPTAEVIKHANPFSSGIPDFSVSDSLDACGTTTKTTWCEVKDIRRKIFVPIQLHRLLKLRGWYLVFNPETKLSYLFPASERAEWTKLGNMTFEETARKIAVFF